MTEPSDQQRLDDATERLGNLIRGVDAVAQEARREARAQCQAGQNDVSADMREIEAKLRIAAGYLTEAYAHGRRLRVPSTGGVIVPFGGAS